VMRHSGAVLTSLPRGRQGARADPAAARAGR
jgi:hypothetical protein